MEPWERALEETRSIADGFIGLTEAEAQRLAMGLGLVLRLHRLDDPQDRVGDTLDIVANRLTLHLRAGVVTRSWAG